MNLVFSNVCKLKTLFVCLLGESPGKENDFTLRQKISIGANAAFDVV